MIQLHQLTIDWLKLRRLSRTELEAALVGRDLAGVNPVPFRDQDQGQYGYPISAGLEDELVDSKDAIEGDRFASVAQQVDVLEAHRRSVLTGRQGRRHMLAHLTEAVSQAKRYDQRFTEIVTGTHHIIPESA